jgi:hypothetical protein
MIFVPAVATTVYIRGVNDTPKIRQTVPVFELM